MKVYDIRKCLENGKAANLAPKGRHIKAQGNALGHSYPGWFGGGCACGMGYRQVFWWSACSGVLIKHRDYPSTFVVFGIAAIVGAGLVCFIWNAGPKTLGQ